jgi:hypothetical protein
MRSRASNGAVTITGIAPAVGRQGRLHQRQHVVTGLHQIDQEQIDRVLVECGERIPRGKERRRRRSVATQHRFEGSMIALEPADVDDPNESHSFPPLPGACCPATANPASML